MRFPGRTTVVFPAQWAVPGTEFLDAETGGQNWPKRPLMPAETERPETIPANIPAETAYLEFAWKPVVRSDWMVVCAVRYEPVSLLFGHYQGDFRKKQRSAPPKRQKALRHSRFFNIRKFGYQGVTGSVIAQHHRESCPGRQKYRRSEAIKLLWRRQRKFLVENEKYRFRSSPGACARHIAYTGFPMPF